jgi:quercetin dioxygenase-like cupin family protein
MAHPQAVLLADLASLTLDESHPEIYDRPIGLCLLHQDPRSGAEHYLVRYPPGLTAQRHRHTAAHTMIVLDGVLEANGELLPPGSYGHFPAGAPMQHGPAGGSSCLFVVIFDGPYDVTAVDEP